MTHFSISSYNALTIRAIFFIHLLPCATASMPFNLFCSLSFTLLNCCVDNLYLDRHFDCWSDIAFFFPFSFQSLLFVFSFFRKWFVMQKQIEFINCVCLFLVRSYCFGKFSPELITFDFKVCVSVVVEVAVQALHCISCVFNPDCWFAFPNHVQPIILNFENEKNNNKTERKKINQLLLYNHWRALFRV